MKAFLKILALGAAAFISLATAQEWDYFSTAWFGETRLAPILTEAQRVEIGKTIFLYLELSSHLYGSQGDTRFAERIPAEPWVVRETQEDIAYLKRNRRVQDSKLVRVSVLGIELTTPSQSVARTREYWVTRTFVAGTDRESDPVRSDVVRIKYQLEHRGTGWRITGWNFDDSGDLPTASSVAPAPLPPSTSAP